ncbi:hypothetical protein [Nocardioides sp. SYSU D00038]|uniref:hypothetical protein n=1 Tax=Nocardioides sp. SYSU D00038 TaxID=2812554 RepID=UPI001966E0B7|nr:hypothetical protein [Nocardioides sp. SYSU D00038]
MSDPEHLSKAEIGKDAIQSTAEAAAVAVGEVASIITTAVKDVATAVGGFATEVFEIREAARRAGDDGKVEDGVADAEA